MANLIESVKDSVAELKRVTWPTKNEVVQATVATCIFVAIFSGILFGVDVLARMGLQELMK